MAQQDFPNTPRTAKVQYGNATAPTPPPAPLPPAHERARYTAPAPDPTFTEDTQPSPVAVLVCHGMGEQVRFETIGQIAGSILRQVVLEGGVPSETGVQLSQQGEGFLARAEINWSHPDGTNHSVHVYEAYWAPITEGKVSYTDTVLFLFSAAWQGFKGSRFFRPSSFKRYLFGSIVDLPVYASTKILVLAIALVLLSQVIGIAVVVAKLTDQFKQIETAHFAIKQVVLVLFPGIHELRDPSISLREHVLTLAALFGWYGLVAALLFVRSFLIQYAGDVAAYISPYRASKFDDIRTRIQDVGLDVAKVIYGFDNVTPVPDYERIVFVGHSLGSVLAYDTLNAIINLDKTSPVHDAHRVVARTSKLITFGSPLDKTAFLFRKASSHLNDPLREQMTSALQPLILDYDCFRRLNFWTNLWSPMDIISGRLQYFDLPTLPADDPLRVENLRDPAAHTFLAAHVQYWDGALLAQTLYDAVK